jgi:hypothetical protein
VDVYVDVSGSVGGYVSALFAAIRACGQLVAPTVFQFSDRVQEVSLSDLARGLVLTTGGTSGEALTAHLAQRSKAAVVVTDGYVGPIPDIHLAACRRARLQVVLTPGGWVNDLAPAASAIHHLEMP